MKKTIALLTVTGALLCVLRIGSSGWQDRTPETLRFIYPEISPIQDTVLLHGTVAAASKDLIYAQGNSRVLECYISEGEQVTAGQCLMKLEQTETASDHQASAASVMYRLQDAVEMGDLQGTAEILQSINMENTSNINHCKEYYLYSSADGIVMKIDAKEGECISSVLPCITLYAPESLQIEAEAGEDVIGLLASDMDCYVSVPAFDLQDLKGRVTSVAPYASRSVGLTGQSSSLTSVRIALSQTGPLRPGYQANAKVVVSSRDQALLLPYETIGQDSSGQEYVLKLQGLRVVKQPVATGSELETCVEITEGLLAHDVVLQTPDLQWEGALIALANR